MVQRRQSASNGNVRKCLMFSIMLASSTSMGAQFDKGSRIRGRPRSLREDGFYQNSRYAVENNVFDLKDSEPSEKGKAGKGKAGDCDHKSTEHPTSKGKGKGSSTKTKECKEEKTKSKGKGKGKGSTVAPAPVNPVTPSPGTPTAPINPVAPSPTPGDGSNPSGGPSPSPGDGNNPSGGPSPSPGDGNNPSGGPSPGDGGPSPSPGTPSEPVSGPEAPTSSKGGVDCAAISAGTASPDGNSLTLFVDMDLTIVKGFDFDQVAEALRKALQKYVAPLISGCDTRRLRLLQDETIILNTVFGTPEREVQGSCKTPNAVSDAECFATETDATLTYTGTETDDFASIIAGAIAEANSKNQLQVPGLLDIAGVDVGVSSDGGGTAGVLEAAENDGDDDGLGTLGIVLISTGAVAALVLAFLIVKRRRSDSAENSHIYLDDDSLAKEIAGDSETEISSPKAHVLGEDDSIASVWTGRRYQDTGDGYGVDGLGDTYATHNVHTCNSSVCEICDSQRKSDPTFIPTGSPNPPPRMPNGAMREYLAEDTVDL